jgi:hypothetical protein
MYNFQRKRIAAVKHSAWDYLLIIKFGKTFRIMGTIELKSNLHKILDKIEDEQLLRTIYDFLKQGQDAGQGEIWKTLTEEQKKEVYESYAESENDKKLIDWEDIKNKF